MKNSTLECTISEASRKDFSCDQNQNGQIVDSKYWIYPYPAAFGLWTSPSDLAILVIELISSLKDES